jgi:hypothetical protein
VWNASGVEVPFYRDWERGVGATVMVDVMTAAVNGD